MSKALVTIMILCVGSLAFADATITVTDIGEADVAALSQPIRAFPVPAAAGWAGPAFLIYDNYAEGLGFSAGIEHANLNWMQPPFGNAQVAIHGVTHDYQYNIDPTKIAIADGTDYFTNIEGSDTDAPEGAPPPDKRWPYHIPRPGRYCGQDFSALYFDLTAPANKFGIFLAAHSNIWSVDPPYPDDHNYVQINSTFDVYVHGIGEDWTLAQTQKVGVSGYCPFLMVEDVDLIDAVTIIHNAGWSGSPTYAFMDIYSDVPEPATLSVLALGALALLRRKRR